MGWMIDLVRGLEGQVDSGCLYKVESVWDWIRGNVGPGYPSMRRGEGDLDFLDGVFWGGGNLGILEVYVRFMFHIPA
jgi:hypothetical protein